MTIRQMNEIIQDGLTLKDITEAYSEISLVRINQIRRSTETARTFFDEITKIYALVKYVSHLNTSNLKPSERVSIVVTSNYRFYGHIDHQLIDFFLGEFFSKESTGDIIVIGQGGSQLLSAQKFPKGFLKVRFKKDIPSNDEISDLVNKIKDYRQVLVYFARSKNILNQIPAVLDISKTQSEATLTKTPELEKTLFIFEPETKQILEFFDSQIKNILLMQVFLESELSRNSSRLISMDDAQYNANVYLKKQYQLLSSVKHSLENSSLLELLSNIKDSIDIKETT